jgi:hypothetical protein
MEFLLACGGAAIFTQVGRATTATGDGYHANSRFTVRECPGMIPYISRYETTTAALTLPPCSASDLRQFKPPHSTARSYNSHWDTTDFGRLANHHWRRSKSGRLQVAFAPPSRSLVKPDDGQAATVSLWRFDRRGHVQAGSRPTDCASAARRMASIEWNDLRVHLNRKIAAIPAGRLQRVLGCRLLLRLVWI